MPEGSVRTTTRAYTLRLTGATPDDHTWRDHLWKTHEAVNAGARVFGEWLLTMRGGLSHDLAEEALQGKPPSEEEQRHRRIVLALSWLSVESPAGAVARHLIVATGREGRDERARKAIAALREVLAGRGLAPAKISEWVGDCEAALSAEIREDAVWVNRSKAFDLSAPGIGGSLLRDELWDLLGRFFGPRSAHLGNAEKSKATYLVGEGESAEEEAGSSKDLVQHAGQWLSSRFGAGAGADFDRMGKVYSAIAEWAAKAADSAAGATVAALADTLQQRFAATPEEDARPLDPFGWVVGLSSYPGHTPNPVHRLLAERPALAEPDLMALRTAALKRAQGCAAKVGSKGRRHYADALLRDVERACGLTYLQEGGRARHAEFAVMLDHAARRVSAAHTWVKHAEAERREFEHDAQRRMRVPPSAKEWLDGFCRARSDVSNALEDYRIRRRAAQGWGQVVAAWSKPDCRTEQDRIDAARALQSDTEEFGDIQLFEALATDDARCVWLVDGTPDSRPLEDYVAATEAEAKRRRFKVPSYRHPDPLRHPVFCDFGYSRWDIAFAAHAAESRPCPDAHGLTLRLWDGTAIQPIKLRWQSKRLWRDLSLNAGDGEAGAAAVARADRLGRGAAGAAAGRPVRVLSVFEQKEWNGRLQAPRGQLDRLAEYVEEHGWDGKAERMRGRLRWLVTFSPRLQPRGPWYDYAAARGLRPRAWPHNEENKHREGLARLLLSRLPGLRVLSVDLGHRAAAACAVWETLSSEQIAGACRAVGAAPPAADALYFHLETQSEDGKPRTAIYRRIGADALPDGTTHPAPWARLERQFTIKLQGEGEQARRATPEEASAVDGFAAWLGRQEDASRGPQRVDELVSHAVSLARLGLRRHGDRARIAWGLTAARKQLPGGREAEHAMTGDELTSHLQDVLLRWHDLAFSARWDDPEARRLWQQHIETLPHCAKLRLVDEDVSRPEQRKQREANRESLRGAAEDLSQGDRTELHSLWATRWQRDDAEWRRRLRWLRDWISPRGRRGEHDRTIRRAGGLSLTRLAAFKSLYQVQKAFFTRLTPEGRQMATTEQGEPAGTPVTAGEEFGQRLLDDLERMRENRVKQLASRIAEAALGIGIERRREGGKMPARPSERVFAPCHAVVIESLTHYRPDELRTRRENRQLMDWSSSKVKKHLSEACELNGLHLREVSPGYTSRQDSRTGAPGVRCQDVAVREFRESPYWRREVARAERNCTGKLGTARERLLCAVEGMLTQSAEGGVGLLRLPRDGGEVFVSANPRSPAAHGLNADLNAAANIGLRALLDPDWEGRWWYVPCEAKEFRPVEKSVKGSVAVRLDCALKAADPAPGAEASDAAPSRRRRTSARGGDREVVNLWRDACTRPITESGGPWRAHREYWNGVQARVAGILRSRLGLPSEG